MIDVIFLIKIVRISLYKPSFKDFKVNIPYALQADISELPYGIAVEFYFTNGKDICRAYFQQNMRAWHELQKEICSKNMLLMRLMWKRALN